MQILLIGSKGQLGSEINELLRNSMHKYIALDSSQLNITNYEKVFNVLEELKPEIIINASAYTDVDNAENDIHSAFQVNSNAVKNLSVACASINSKLIHVSTDYVFDGSLKSGYTEDHSTSPLSVYGQSKLEGENNIRENLNAHYIVRTSWVFGKNGKNFVKTILALAEKNNEVKVVNDQYGKPTSAASLAKIILMICEKLIENDPIDYGTYNFANYPCVSWFEFANEIFQEAKNQNILTELPKLSPVKSDEFNSLAKRPKFSNLITDKINYTLTLKKKSWIE